MTTTEHVAHILSSQGHRITYELQVNCWGEVIGERLWHYDLCPQCRLVPKRVQNVGKAAGESSHPLLEDGRINL